MKKILFSFLFLIAQIFSQINHNDGPYVIIDNNKLIEKNIIKKSRFFVSNHPYVKQTSFLIYILVSSMGEFHQNWGKIFKKKLKSPIGNNGQIYMLMYYGGNKKTFFFQNFENPPNM